jgi:hypothetical protein
MSNAPSRDPQESPPAASSKGGSTTPTPDSQPIPGTTSDTTPDTPPEPADAGESGGVVSVAIDAAIYGLSLPERVARAMVGCTSGLVKETAQMAVPDAFKQSRLYDMTIRKMLGFLVEDVGMMKSDAAGESSEKDEEKSQYVVKKAVGNVIDVAGMTVMHVSPLWVLAIFSDVTLGTKKYLNVLTDELKKDGIIDESATIDNIDHLLGALERTSGALVESLDTPPVTMQQLKKAVTTLRDESAKVDLSHLIPAEDMNRVWNELQETAQTEGRSVLEVSSAVGMMAFSQISKVGKGALTTAKVSFDLFEDNVIDYYFGAFDRIHENGYYQSVLETYEPYSQGLKYLFHDETETTTEQVLRGKVFRRIWNKMKGWCC